MVNFIIYFFGFIYLLTAIIYVVCYIHFSNEEHPIISFITLLLFILIFGIPMLLAQGLLKLFINKQE